MTRANWQKIKLLKLLEILKETDKEHPLSTMELCERVEKLGIPCDRRTLSKDIALLKESGYEIESHWHERDQNDPEDRSRALEYFIEDRDFEAAELKILIDAVQAASFITANKTEKLVDKIVNLGSKSRGLALKKNRAIFNTRKRSNELILYNIDHAEEAIQKRKKLRFLYFKLDHEGKEQLHNGGNYYEVEPLALIYNSDNYYLRAYDPKNAEPRNYRIDRMKKAELLDEAISGEAYAYLEDIDTYTKRVFKMYGGELRVVELKFTKEQISSVHDRFGDGIHMTDLGGGQYSTKVEVQISPMFWGWVAQFGGQMEILSPVEAVEAYRKHLRRCLGIEAAVE